ncbi:superoxide dismutase [Pseudoroseomonas cervicalis]|uniref:Superoxide dismutase n=1 Tax=Pseudoroseomonas cervicalis ATCC 49957 TaxID=525371 RepID=D5RL70_9PROT|nr:superoxide dismutase [Pseudoroseomonas cervicalis]EFH11947.1 superoxide dismutase, Mn/Fe family [Pseudoroseomonas cervicalis ATCC 49957]
MTTPLIARRGALFAAGSLLAAGLLPGRVFAQAAAPAQPSGPFTLPALPYAANALEPHIDAATMELHHGRHHAAYVNNLNAALRDHGQLASLKLEELLAKLGEAPEAVRTTLRNNGGGHANHSMFWQIMGGRGGNPSGELAEAINRDLGGMEKFRTDFNGAGARVFGSGWVFVTVDREGKLALNSRPNQDTPLMDGQRVLMGNDVWEHAYYLKYNNRRPEYLAAWWNVLDWAKIGERYAAAKAGTLGV